MSARWVAGCVRARALARRRIGAAAARDLAASPDLDTAVQALRASPYGARLPARPTLAHAERGLADTLLWHARVLAGWLPTDGVVALRLLAGWFEIANIDEHVHLLGREPGTPAPAPFALGALATAWPRLAATTSPGDLRTALRGSAWGDLGDNGHDIHLTACLTWAVRVAAGVAPAAAWARGGAAVLVAREVYLAGRRLPAVAVPLADRLFGPGWASAGDLTDFIARVHRDACWPLRTVTTPGDLWRAETAWWARVQADGTALLTGSGFGPQPPIGAVAVLAADAWRVRAALESAARGGRGADLTGHGATGVADALA
ncbi:MAG TPA: hypothetical protein VF054_18950 [Micromonosporaceae bacterium]